MKLRYVIPSWGGVGVLAFSLKGGGDQDYSELFSKLFNLTHK